MTPVQGGIQKEPPAKVKTAWGQSQGQGQDWGQRARCLGGGYKEPLTLRAASVALPLEPQLIPTPPLLASWPGILGPAVSHRLLMWRFPEDPRGLFGVQFNTSTIIAPVY